MRPFAVVAVVFLAVLLGTISVATSAFAEPVQPVPRTTVQVQTAIAPLLKAPPLRTAEQIAAGELALQELAELRRQRVLAIPIGTGAPPVPTAPTQVGAAALMEGGLAPAAPGDFTVFRSTVLTDAFTNNSTSSTDEPSLGMNCETVFYSGNWYASVSDDGGQNFTFVDPAATFPSFSGGFCCDQVVYYEESRGLMFWYLQYSRDGNGNNTIVLAWTTSNAATQTGAWTFVAITPQDLGYGDAHWFDFPELSVSDNYVYFTTDVVGSSSNNAVAVKAQLDDVADGGAISFSGFFSDEAFLRPTHGAAGTMYIGEHRSTSEMRIYTWAEADGVPGSSVDRTVNTWLTGTYSAPSPDGTDYLNFGIPSLLAAWIADGKIGFMWDSVQGDGYAWPNVRVATFNVAGLTLADQHVIWNSDFAFAYPSVHPNDEGNLGGTIAFGGGNPPPGNPAPYPSFAAWISDDFNGDPVFPATVYPIALGDAGPASDRWGDYLTSRRAIPYGDTWATTGFVLNGGQTGASVDPYFVWFGREEDTPQPEITCPGDITVECKDPCGTPANDAQLAAFFGGVSASDPCPLTVSDDAPTCFGFGTTTVTFTAENDLGLSNTCTADVEVVDTTPPDITCPGDITVECSDFCGTPATDPQLIAFFEGVSATDICDTSPAISDDSPMCFPEGTTTVTFTATDASGNERECTADVTVVDTTPPEITVTLDRYAMWPPNHKLVCIEATVEVTDICDSDPDWVLESIESNEPDNGKGDGNTVGDIAEADTGTTDVEFKLRSERDGRGDGRKYTIIYRAWDSSGNVAWDTACVDVPHDQSGTALASTGFNSTGTALELGVGEFAVVIPSHKAVFETKGNRELLVRPALDASEILVSQAYIGNTAGVAAPIRHSLRGDVNNDGLVDLVLWYKAVGVLAIKAATDAITPEIVAAGAIHDGPIGLHFLGGDNTPYLVTSVFSLGEPIAIGEEEDEPEIKDDLALSPTGRGEGGNVSFEDGITSIHPNPFNPATTIRFTLANPGNVTIAIYDVNGALVRILVDQAYSSGEYAAEWDGTDARGRTVATGVYFARMISGTFQQTRKMVLLK